MGGAARQIFIVGRRTGVEFLWNSCVEEGTGDGAGSGAANFRAACCGLGFCHQPTILPKVVVEEDYAAAPASVAPRPRVFVLAPSLPFLPRGLDLPAESRQYFGLRKERQMSKYTTVGPEDIDPGEFIPDIKHEDLRSQWQQGDWTRYVSMRIERALSWLEQAERSAEERDYFLAFISYWISYNSLYGKYQPKYRKHRQNRRGVPEAEQKEYKMQEEFHKKISECKNGKGLQGISRILTEKRRVVEGIVCHEFLSQPHWNYLHFEAYGHGEAEEPEWRSSKGWKNWLDKDKKSLDEFLRRLDANPGDTDAVKEILDLLFTKRIYTLRSQVIHGGSVRGRITSSEDVFMEERGYTNISQVSRSAKIMVFLIPLFIKVVMENPRKDLWSNPGSPVIDRGDARLRQ